MIRRGNLALAILVMTVLGVDARAAEAPSSPEARAQVDAGKQLFETTCASNTCHGSAGVGAQGPRLADRNLSLDMIRDAIAKGRPGTPMPPFADLLEPGMMAQVTAYVLSISMGGRIPALVSAGRPAQSESAPAAAMPVSVAIGRETGNPAAGAAVFFNAARLESCRACHSFRDNGGPVGPDLAGLGKSALEIYQAITRPKVPGAAFPAVTVTAKDGRKHVGIKGGETGEVLRLIDISSIPPVVRSFLKSELAAVAAVADTGVFDHTALAHSKQELLDVAAFIGKPAPSK